MRRLITGPVPPSVVGDRKLTETECRQIAVAHTRAVAVERDDLDIARGQAAKVRGYQRGGR